MGDDVCARKVVRDEDDLVWDAITRVGHRDSLTGLVGESRAAVEGRVGLSLLLEFGKVHDEDVGGSGRCSGNTKVVDVVGRLSSGGDVTIGRERWGGDSLPSEG